VDLTEGKESKKMSTCRLLLITFTGTVSQEGQIPTVTDNLLSQGTISTESIGIFYQPTTEENLANGELTFGGVDESK